MPPSGTGLEDGYSIHFSKNYGRLKDSISGVDYARDMFGICMEGVRRRNGF
jgi:hypothetical protein